MKNILFVVSVIGSAVLLPQVHAEDVSGVGAVMQGSCGDIKSNDVGSFRKKLKLLRRQYSVKVDHVFPTSSCEGVDFITYAIDNGSMEMAEFITKRVSASSLAEKGLSKKDILAKLGL